MKKQKQPERPKDPKFRCAYVTRKGTRCTRMTTTYYCNVHAKMLTRKMKGLLK